MILFSDITTKIYQRKDNKNRQLLNGVNIFLDINDEYQNTLNFYEII